MWGGRGGGVRKSIWGRGGMGWGGKGGVKNKFGLKCFLDDFKCYKAFFLRPCLIPTCTYMYINKIQIPKARTKLNVNVQIHNN